MKENVEVIRELARLDNLQDKYRRLITDMRGLIAERKQILENTWNTTKDRYDLGALEEIRCFEKQLEDIVGEEAI